MIRPIPTSLALLAAFAATGEAGDHFFARRQVVYTPTATVASPAQMITVQVQAVSTPPTVTATTRPVPAPSRPIGRYVGYGDDGFPFQGRPYGHPYDPWTWAYLGGGYGGSLARYYDPPVK